MIGCVCGGIGELVIVIVLAVLSLFGIKIKRGRRGTIRGMDRDNARAATDVVEPVGGARSSVCDCGRSQ